MSYDNLKFLFFSFLMFTQQTLICSEYFCNRITLCLSNDNTVYSFGFSKFLAHGHEDKQVLYPKQINGLKNIKYISCSATHSICIDYNGDAFSFGFNDKGQLGIEKEFMLHFTHIPSKISLSHIKQVSCGQNFSIFLSEDGLLYSFGANDFGQLGLGNTKGSLYPQQISHLVNVKYIQCGESFTICKTYGNTFYSWGQNFNGQLGQGDKNIYNKPTQCMNMPDNIIDIKCGALHVLVLTKECFVYGIGSNTFGQLGFSTTKIYTSLTPKLIEDIPEIQRIECGYNHSMCIDINYNLWVFGDNQSGQLGLGDAENRHKPVLHPTLSNIMDISSGGKHTFVKTIDNKIYAFGNNNHSQLGIETSEENQLKPIQIFQDNGDIWCSRIGKSRAKSARK